MTNFEYHKKRLEFDKYFIDKFYNSKTTENEKIIITLQKLDSDIEPYSYYARMGFKKRIRKVIKILKEVLEEWIDWQVIIMNTIYLKRR